MHTELGKWIRKPYQIFPYIYDSGNKLLYKRVGRRWEIFELRQGTRNVYQGTPITKDQTPNEWMPVKVICLSNNAIKVIAPTEAYSHSNSTTIPDVGNFEEDYNKAFIGKFSINDTALQILLTLWKTQKVELVCGSDGGLKNQIGTSGYVICMGVSADPVIWGYAAEQQGNAETSSTRQELLAQLGIEYWLSHLTKIWGRPKESLEVQLITDSQASIIMVENMDRKVGMQMLLRPDGDVVMEVWQQRKNKPFSQMTVHKVKSHISHTKLKEKIHKAATSEELQDFLCRKYGWTTRIFDMVDWSVLNCALKKLSLTADGYGHEIYPWMAGHNEETQYYRGSSYTVMYALSRRGK